MLPQLCPAGVYGGDAGLASPSCLGPCSAGYYCPAGSVNATTAPCGGVTLYCPSNSGAPVAVPLGSYSLPEQPSLALVRSASMPCQPGEYCVSGLRYLCPGGTHSSQASRSEACVDLCFPGIVSCLRCCIPVDVVFTARCRVWAGWVGLWLDRLLLPQRHCSSGAGVFVSGHVLPTRVCELLADRCWLLRHSRTQHAILQSTPVRGGPVLC